MTDIKHINSYAEFDALVKKTKNPTSLLVADFWATWCGPCRVIAPVFQRLATQYPEAVFVKVDVDKQQQTAQSYKVTAMPTFKFFKDGKEVDSVRGADAASLEAKVKQHYVAPAAAESSGTGGMASSVNGYPDITSNIDIKNLECLNQQDSHHLRNTISPGSAYLESDVDEQLSIFFAFLQPCKIYSLSLSCTSEGHRPKTLRFYTNRPNAIGFDEAEGVEPTQEIELTEENYDAEGIATINLRFVKFQRVNTLSIFVVDNLGDEETTRIENLRLYGETMDVTRMSEINKKEDP